MNKYVYLFSEGDASMRSLLGGKGANLAEMQKIGLPVPPGMTITTEACLQYYEAGAKMPDGLTEEIRRNLAELERLTGKKFGDPHNPLLVSVRSGAAISMPGMMDTILNLGLNETTTAALAEITRDRRFAYDSYRRFIQMFSDVVLEVPKAVFEEILEQQKKAQGVREDQELSPESLRIVIDRYKETFQKYIGEPFAEDPVKQLMMAVEAVFRSWNTDRAIVYRNLNKIDHHMGTAVNIQFMVFGNMGGDSGTGVAFTRNPSTGENALYGEYLINAQGEDVVAGIRTPQPIARLEEEMPAIYRQFVDIARKLEKHYRNMQDIEFTIEKGKLYILQTRNGKRATQAAVKIAYDLFREGLVGKEDALLLVDPAQLAQLLHQQVDPSVTTPHLAAGLPASPGAACGKAVFSADKAAAMGKNGDKVILIRTETTPDDIHGIVEAQATLTSRGGMTSHAAVVARGMGKPCVCGCDALKINYAAAQFTVGDVVIKEGDLISVDGTTGRVYQGEVPMQSAEFSSEVQTILEWADEIKTLDVRANADTPEDARKSRQFGATGIGLTRTEHMFMARERLPFVQKMILAETLAEREAALARLLPMQEDDFYHILKAMEGYPVCIRLLDPPLHEFLPSLEDLLVETTELRVRGGDEARLRNQEILLEQVRKLHEFNPMLGHRGCRLGMSYPEIYEMQMRAIFNAAARLTRENLKVLPEIEIPLALSEKELAIFKEKVTAIAREAMAKYGVEFAYSYGAMIELPRAALLADELAKSAEFFSFGTNDLTQTCLGFSRDDAEGKFLPIYIQKGVLRVDPFAVIDRQGVGELMRIAVAKGRRTRPGMPIGICGEHGGDPESIEFCHEIGLDSVSCSPYRVPIARLAAAHAAIKSKRAQ